MSGVEGEVSREQVTCSGEVGGEDLVVVKISLLGDCQIGKTSFMVIVVPEIDPCFFFFWLVGWSVGWLMLVFFCVFAVKSWKIKYVGDEEEQSCFQLSGLNKMEKVLAVQAN